MTDDPRIHVDLAYLAGLEARAAGFDFLPRQPVGSVLFGETGGEGSRGAGSSSRRSAATCRGTTSARSTGR